MVFKTLKDLSVDLVRNIDKIPKDIDLIIGIPRSGLMVATIIALYLNKPVADLDTFSRGELPEAGRTKNKKGWITSFEDVKKVLIVEDTADTGKSIIGAKNRIEQCGFNKEYVYLAGYVTSQSKSFVDIYFDIINQPRLFEWNYLHHRSMLLSTCMDMDGVLCDDPTDEENDDGDRYIKFIKEAKPKLIPSSKIGWIVTSRLEKYRNETEAWLRDHNIDYGELIMMNLDTAEERRQLGNHALFKADVFKKKKSAILFVESEETQAEKIYQLTGKCVLCSSTLEYYNEGVLRTKKRQIKYKAYRIINSYIPRWLKDLIKKILNSCRN